MRYVWPILAWLLRRFLRRPVVVVVLKATPPAPGRIVDVRSDPRRASFWRDVRARESLSGDTPDADRLLRRLYPEE